MNKKVCLPVFVIALLVLVAPSAANTQRTYGQSDVQATVQPDALNVRDQPLPDAAIVGQYPRNMLLNVSGREDELGDTGIWVYTTPVDGGISGWVRSDYLVFPVGFNVYDLPVTYGAAAAAPVTGESQAPAEQPAPPAPAQPADIGLMSGSTKTGVYFRTGPATTYNIIQLLPAGTPVALTGRNSANTWVQAVVGGQEGWLFASLISITGDPAALPVIGGNTPDAPAAPEAEAAAPSLTGGVVPVIGPRARAIFLAGQSMGNRRDVFSKVGDSITESSSFLFPIGVGGLQLHSYAYLQPVVDFFTQTPAGSHNSFAVTSLAARGGFTSSDLLNPASNYSGACQGGESPLVCEYRVHKPSVALIMIGTNDVNFNVSINSYRANLEAIVQTSIDMGVIPVLSTIPDNLRIPDGGRVHQFNSVIISVANAFGVPLWDYWQAMRTLPNYGMSGDGYHPSVPPIGETGVFTPENLSYGYTMRNLTALMVLDAVWKSALY